MQDHPVQIIGWRHAEKLYETLATAQELTAAEDLDDYWRLQQDERDLNYGSYFDKGEEKTANLEDYHSHNTERLDLDGVKKLLLSLPEVQSELAKWKKTTS